MGAIEDDAETFEGHAAGEAGLGVFDVAADGVVDTEGLADLAGGGADVLDLAGEDEVLDAVLDVVGELVAIGAEELDAVVIVRIVGGGDDDAGVGAEGAGDVGDAGAGEGADEDDVNAHGKDAGGKGVFEHVTGEAGVLSDDDAVAQTIAGLTGEVAEDVGGGAAELEGGLGGDRFHVGAATDAVGAEDAFRVRHDQGGVSGVLLCAATIGDLNPFDQYFLRRDGAELGPGGIDMDGVTVGVGR